LANGDEQALVSSHLLASVRNIVEVFACFSRMEENADVHAEFSVETEDDEQITKVMQQMKVANAADASSVTSLSKTSVSAWRPPVYDPSGKVSKKTGKRKTFNRLDERFQLDPSIHSDEHIFPEELDLIRQMRQRNLALKQRSDKWLAIFLIARRHNLDAAMALLDTYLKREKLLGFDKKPPQAKDCVKMFRMGQFMHITNTYDKYERMIHYIIACKDFSKTIPTPERWAAYFYEQEREMDEEPLRYWRNGITLVVDLRNWGLRNLDFSSAGKEINNALTGLFPNRMRALCVFRAGTFLRIGLKAARTVFPAKMMKRIMVISTDELKELVPAKYLLKEYGGDPSITPDDVYQSMIARDVLKSKLQQLAPKSSNQDDDEEDKFGLD